MHWIKRLQSILEVEVVDGRIEAVGENYSNHVLTKLLQNELEEGRDLREIYYQEDVQRSIPSCLEREGPFLSRICVQTTIIMQGKAYSHIKAKRPSALSGRCWWDIPNSKVSMTVDLLLTERVDETQPLLYTKADGTQVELSAENYVEELAGERFTAIPSIKLRMVT